MSRILSLLFCVALGGSVYGQTDWKRPKPKDYPRIRKAGHTITDFVPRDFAVVDSATGELNGDGDSDVAVVIKGNLERFLNTNKNLGTDIYDTNPRILLILFGNENGLRLAEQNNSFIIAPDSPASSEPFVDISIKNRVLRIDLELWQSAGSWSTTNATYKFRYSGRDFRLIGAELEEYMRNSVETERRSYNFLTRRKKVTNAIREGLEDHAKYKPPTVRWSRLRRPSRKSLRAYGPAFSWEVESGIFL